MSLLCQLGGPKWSDSLCATGTPHPVRRSWFLLLFLSKRNQDSLEKGWFKHWARKYTQWIDNELRASCDSGKLGSTLKIHQSINNGKRKKPPYWWEFVKASGTQESTERTPHSQSWNSLGKKIKLCWVITQRWNKSPQVYTDINYEKVHK